MNTQTETKLLYAISEAATKTENPMQERYCSDVSESVEVTAEAAFAARRLESYNKNGPSTRGEAGPVFIP